MKLAFVALLVLLPWFAEARIIREAGIRRIRACVSQDGGEAPTGHVEFDTVDEAGEPVDHVALPISSLLSDAERAQARGLLAVALARLHQQYAIPTPSPTPAPTPTPFGA
jgi:hypothetical protein